MVDKLSPYQPSPAVNVPKTWPWVQHHAAGVLRRRKWVNVRNRGSCWFRAVRGPGKTSPLQTWQKSQLTRDGCDVHHRKIKAIRQTNNILVWVCTSLRDKTPENKWGTSDKNFKTRAHKSGTANKNLQNDKNELSVGTYIALSTCWHTNGNPTMLLWQLFHSRWLLSNLVLFLDVAESLATSTRNVAHSVRPHVVTIP